MIRVAHLAMNLYMVAGSGSNSAVVERKEKAG